MVDGMGFLRRVWRGRCHGVYNEEMAGRFSLISRWSFAGLVPVLVALFEDTYSR